MTSVAHRHAPPAAIRGRTCGASGPREQWPREEVAPELDAICAKALAFEPGKRFPSARALSDAVEAFLDGDRDLALRHEVAARHLGRARAASSRTVALQEAFRGLALHPEDHEARGLVAGLLLEAPREAPSAAEAELAEAETTARRNASKEAAKLYLTWLAFLPIAIAMGVRSWALLTTCPALVLATSLVAFLVGRVKKPTDGHGALLLALAMTMVGSVSIVFGPFVVVPALAATNAQVFALFATKKLRPAITVAALLAVLGPFGLERLGVLDSSMVFQGGNLILVGRAVALTSGWGSVFLVTTSAAAVLIAMAAVGRSRDELAAARRQSFLQAWHLRQMVE